MLSIFSPWLATPSAILFLLGVLRKIDIISNSLYNINAPQLDVLALQHI